MFISLVLNVVGSSRTGRHIFTYCKTFVCHGQQRSSVILCMHIHLFSHSTGKQKERKEKALKEQEQKAKEQEQNEKDRQEQKEKDRKENERLRSLRRRHDMTTEEKDK